MIHVHFMASMKPAKRSEWKKNFHVCIFFLLVWKWIMITCAVQELCRKLINVFTRSAIGIEEYQRMIPYLQLYPETSFAYWESPCTTLPIIFKNLRIHQRQIPFQNYPVRYCLLFYWPLPASYVFYLFRRRWLLTSIGHSFRTLLPKDFSDAPSPCLSRTLTLN